MKAPGIEAPPDFDNMKSPETYVGSERAENFVSTGGHFFSDRGVYASPGPLSLNHWSLVGDWTVGKHSAVLNKANGRIVYRFHARDLHLVMGPAVAGAPVRFRVLIDGKLPGAAGKKAQEEFNRLPAEAIFVLIDGFNRAANIEASCPAVRPDLP